jgi:hypothetical protein
MFGLLKISPLPIAAIVGAVVAITSAAHAQDAVRPAAEGASSAIARAQAEVVTTSATATVHAHPNTATAHRPAAGHIPHGPNTRQCVAPSCWRPPIMTGIRF